MTGERWDVTLRFVGLPLPELVVKVSRCHLLQSLLQRGDRSLLVLEELDAQVRRLARAALHELLEHVGGRRRLVRPREHRSRAADLANTALDLVVERPLLSLEAGRRR